MKMSARDNVQGRSLLPAREETNITVKRYEASVAHAHLKLTCGCIIVCVFAFLTLVLLRLSLDSVSYDLWVDFVPLWFVPLFIYLTAVDLAATKINENGTTDKAAIVVGGFLLAVVLQGVSVLVCLKIEEILDWSWMSVFRPCWGVLLMVQCGLLLVTPGFVREQKTKLIFVVFFAAWLVAFCMLLTALKLDSRLPLDWWAVLVPLWVIVVAQLLTAAHPMIMWARAMILLFFILLPLKLDSTLEWPWWTIFVPLFVMLITEMLMICIGIEKSEDVERSAENP